MASPPLPQVRRARRRPRAASREARQRFAARRRGAWTPLAPGCSEQGPVATLRTASHRLAERAFPADFFAAAETPDVGSNARKMAASSVGRLARQV